MNKCKPRELKKMMHKNYHKNLTFFRSVGTLRADYHKQPFDIIAHDMTSFGANKLPAFGRHRSHTTVEQFLFSKHKVTLDYSHLPCITMFHQRDPKTGICKGFSQFAIETLYIVPDDDIDSVSEDFMTMIVSN